MKITARVLVEDRKVALDCKPFFGALYTVYVTWIPAKEGGDIGDWVLPSGRLPTKSMLDAIDQLPGISLKSRSRAKGAT